MLPGADIQFSPETVESLFIAWRLTGDVRYREYAWGIFQAIEKHCRLPGGGYATILDVDTVPVRHDDKQETFYLVRLTLCVWIGGLNFLQSETLKYLFLTFADGGVLPLDGMSYSLFTFRLSYTDDHREYVLNTEVNRIKFMRSWYLFSSQAHPLPIFRPSIKPMFSM